MSDEKIHQTAVEILGMARQVDKEVTRMNKELEDLRKFKAEAWGLLFKAGDRLASIDEEGSKDLYGKIGELLDQHPMIIGDEEDGD